MRRASVFLARLPQGFRRAACASVSAIALGGALAFGGGGFSGAHAEAASGSGAAQIVESATGISFPLHMGSLTATGAGCRYKYGFAKVYAVALFVDAHAAKKTGASPDDTLAAVLAGGIPSAVSIKLARSVGSRDLSDALSDAIAQRIKARAERDSADAGADLAALAALGTALTTTPLGATLPLGTEIIFTRKTGGLEVFVNGKSTGVFSSPRLEWAFYDTYLGDAPVVPAARAAFKAGIEAMRK